MTDFRICTERLVLRSWTDADVEPCSRMLLTPGFSDYLLPLAGPEAAREWVMHKRSHFGQHGFGPFVAELRQCRTFVGCIGLSVVPYDAVFTPAVEIAWRLALEHRGRGLATEAARAALADGFIRLGLSDIVANTVPANLASLRVMQRIGMRYDLAFDHPLIAARHPLRRQVLYRATAPAASQNG